MSDDGVFEAHREHCRGLAYRMLGSRAEAEDIVQEAWLRWRRADEVRNPAAWLTTTVTRLCLDQLASARVRREHYVGPWLPEPVDTSAAAVDPDGISMAFMLLLERLSPTERAVFLLHKVFDVDYAEIAQMLGKTEAAVRQIHHRAREHLEVERPRRQASAEEHMRLLTAFLLAVQSGDVPALEALLADDVRSFNDGGGKVRAARKVVEGRSRVARKYIGIARKGDTRHRRPELRQINGRPALVLWTAEGPTSVLTIETDGILIQAIYVVVNPDKLVGLFGPSS